jgi:hypothetical protein
LESKEINEVAKEIAKTNDMLKEIKELAIETYVEYIKLTYQSMVLVNHND